ncbi:MAG: glycosyltransferase [Chitinophagaceae bacterium]
MMPLERNVKLMIMVDWYAPGYKAGGQIRSIKNLVDTLQDTLDIYIVTSDNDLGDTSLYLDMEKNKWLKFHNHHVIYLNEGKRNISSFIHLIREVKPDIVYLNSMFSYDFTIKPLLGILTIDSKNIKVILSPRGMLQKGAMQFKNFKKRFYLAFLKIIGIQKRIIFHSTDDTESLDIVKYFGSSVKIRQTPDFFASQINPFRQIVKNKGQLNILFVSRISGKKNLLFSLKVLSEIKTDKNISFKIIGPIESEHYWSTCQKIIERMPPHVQVHYEGSVHPADLQEYYLASHLFFLPTYGENFGHVIFDSFMYGRPVLISDQTPWKNLREIKCGSDFSLDQPYLFKSFLEDAAEWDQKEFDEWCLNAWHYAEEKLQNTNLQSIYTELFSHV